MSSLVDRAILLQQQNRPADAERELRNHLTEEPQDPYAHAILAECLAAQKKLPEATDEARLAITSAPDMAVGHYVLAKVLHARHHYPEALAAANQAIQLDSFHVEAHAFKAVIQLSTEDWGAALRSAENALSLDPENEAATNVRAMAQMQLGRHGEASETLHGTLSRNPESALSHATRGWSLLHANNPSEAMVHFRESLRLDPTNEYAQLGMVEAIKARNPVYRVMLMYFLWMSRQSSKAQWAVIIGVMVGRNILRGVADANPNLRPFIYPVVILVSVFVLMTWIAHPLSNLLLRLHPMGKHALSRDQRVGANLMGGVILAAVISFALGVMINPSIAPLAILCLAMTIPLAPIMVCDRGWPRYLSGAMAALVGVAGLGAWVIFFLSKGDLADSPAAVWLGVFIVGIFLASLANNFLMKATVRN